VDLRRALDDGVLTVTLDDGAKNVLDPDAFAALIAVLDEEPAARAVVLAGPREGILSRGWTSSTCSANGRDGTRELLVAFGTA
jgi:enoyl-CoA hydratase/carnithine racemase